MKGNVGVDTSWHHATGNFCILLYEYVLRKGSMNQFLGIGLFIIYSVCTMETKEFFVLCNFGYSKLGCVARDARSGNLVFEFVPFHLPKCPAC